MLVIHGLWAYGACHLWAEDSALPAAAPARPGRPRRAPRPHPFAPQASGLARALARLPEPAAGLAGQAGAGSGRPGERRVSLALWRVPALVFEPAPAVDLLTVLGEPGAPSGEVVGGGSARYLAAVARLGADLAARGRVLPALRAEDGGPAPRWRPVLSGADAERARELAAGMPVM